MSKLLRFLLFLYRKFYYGPSVCRFYPSCSVFADQAIARYGAAQGSFLALKRLIRCNRWFAGGYDPVP